MCKLHPIKHDGSFNEEDEAIDNIFRDAFIKRRQSRLSMKKMHRDFVHQMVL